MQLNRLFISACALAAAMAAPRSARAQTPVRFSGAAAIALPVGNLGDAADVGFNLAVRGESRIASSNWNFRGDLSYDRFPGRGAALSYSYLGASGNMVHRTTAGRFYEYGGLGLYGSRTAFGGALNQDQTNLGAQMGLGLDLNPGPHTPFVEFGATHVFTGGSNSLWFPVRFGVRF